MLYSLVYSEITLKGRKRNLFENILVRNIESIDGVLSVSRKGGRLVVDAADSDRDAVLAALQKTFGVEYVSPSLSVRPDMEAIRDVIASHEFPGKIRVYTKRADKGFPLRSQEVNEVVGQDLVDRGAKVDLKHPDHTIYIDILADEALISFERYRCPSGLPVGSSGRVLSLLSGGIDSPVASWLMMRRGCLVDYLHLHPFPANADVSGTKIVKIANMLKGYHPPKSRLFIAPYGEFYKRTLSLGSRNELVVFRRFLVRLANELAKKHGYKAIVTGDSLGQVASQTLDNLITTTDASMIPVLRPLITYNKQDIIDLSRRIGLYESSVEPYKDCCSLVAHKKPSTRVDIEAAREIEQEIGMDDIVEKTVARCDIIALGEASLSPLRLTML